MRTFFSSDEIITRSCNCLRGMKPEKLLPQIVCAVSHPCKNCPHPGPLPSDGRGRSCSSACTRNSDLTVDPAMVGLRTGMSVLRFGDSQHSFYFISAKLIPNYSI